MPRETMPSFVANVGRALVIGPLLGLGIVYALSRHGTPVDAAGPISVPVGDTPPGLCGVIPQSVAYDALGRQSLTPAYAGAGPTPGCTWVRSDLAGSLSVSLSRAPHDLADARAVATPPLVAGLQSVPGLGRRAVLENGLSTVTAILTDGRVLQVRLSRTDGIPTTQTDATVVQVARQAAAALATSH